jgi:hypothetical protein
MVLAMLYALDGQPGRALEVAQGLAEVAGSGSWLESQTNTFIAAISLPSTTSLSLCAALTAADDFPACDIDSVLARLFRERPVMRDEPMIDQLEARGIPVLESVMVSEIGLADRLVLNLDLAGASWWAFAPVDPEYYIAERSDPPGRFEAAVFPLAAVDVPQAGYDALLLENDLRGALTVLDTVIQDNPGLPLSPAARYFDALLHDLSGDRQGARERYFGLWRELPTNLWGQLAGHHLERR